MVGTLVNEKMGRIPLPVFKLVDEMIVGTLGGKKVSSLIQGIGRGVEQIFVGREPFARFKEWM